MLLQRSVLAKKGQDFFSVSPPSRGSHRPLPSQRSSTNLQFLAHCLSAAHLLLFPAPPPPPKIQSRACTLPQPVSHPVDLIHPMGRLYPTRIKLPAQGTAKPTRPGPEQGVVFDNQVPCLTSIPPIHHPPPVVPRHGSFLPKRESPLSIQLLARIAHSGPKIFIFEPNSLTRVAAFYHFDSTRGKTGHISCISPSFHLLSFTSTCRRSAESGDLNHRRTSKRLLLLHSDSVSAAPYIIRTHASVKDLANRWHAMTSL